MKMEVKTKSDAISRIATIATELTGIQLNDRHREMIRSRLHKRIENLGLKSLDEYLVYLESNRSKESPTLIGLLTTHHTFFFREFSHFEYLGREILPKLKQELLKREDRTLEIWSAACSRGQEVYSLAMFLDHHLPKIDASLKYRIYGTDVDPESVKIASNGVYARAELKEAPLVLVGNHWSRGTGKISEFVKAKKTLKDHCKFGVLNLLKEKDFDRTRKFDIIFCRNVFIYFNPAQIRTITNSLLLSLREPGYLVVGISESLSQLDMPLKALGPSVYIRKSTTMPTAERVEVTSSNSLTPKTDTTTSAISEKPIRVLCVDDSKTILTLLKKLLVPEVGFQVVGTAENGKEAVKMVAELKPDILTLDIHMPEMTGLEYLEQNFKSGHPPVVMLTSVSREDQALAGKALSLGATDYIEKPALSTIVTRKEEICWKLKCAFEASKQSLVADLRLDRSFEKSDRILNPSKCQKIILASLANRKRLIAFLKENPETKGVPALLLIPGIAEIMDAVAGELSKAIGKQVEISQNWPLSLSLDKIYLVAEKEWDAGVSISRKNQIVSSLDVFGNVSGRELDFISKWEGAQFLLEDVGSNKSIVDLEELADDIVPYTSFDYLAAQFFSKNGKKSDGSAA